jgi:hypothetical protein
MTLQPHTKTPPRNLVPSAEAIARVGTGIAGLDQPGYDGPIMNDLSIPAPGCATRPGLPFPSVYPIQVSRRINDLREFFRIFSVIYGRPAGGGRSFARDHI